MSIMEWGRSQIFYSYIIPWFCCYIQQLERKLKNIKLIITLKFLTDQKDNIEERHDLQGDQLQTVGISENNGEK